MADSENSVNTISFVSSLTSWGYDYPDSCNSRPDFYEPMESRKWNSFSPLVSESRGLLRLEMGSRLFPPNSKNPSPASWYIFDAIQYRDRGLSYTRIESRRTGYLIVNISSPPIWYQGHKYSHRSTGPTWDLMKNQGQMPLKSLTLVKLQANKLDEDKDEDRVVIP